MKAAWKTKTLDEILVKTETLDPQKKPNESFEYIDVSSVSNRTFSIEDTQQLLGKNAPSRARKLVQKNDVLFATVRPTLKRIAMVPKGLNGQICSTGYFVLRPIPTVDHRFVFYFLQTQDFMAQMEALQKGASYPAVTDAQVREQKILVPSLPEQQRIVGILDEAFEGISKARANAERNLKNSRELFESVRENAFVPQAKGWTMMLLGEVAKTQYGLSEQMNRSGNGYKIFRMGELQDEKLIDTGRMKFADIDQTEFEKYRLKRKDVLFNRTNSYELVGKTGIFDLPGNYCFASYLIRVMPDNKKLIPKLLNQIMNTSRFQRSVKSKAAKSVNQANINATILSNETISFPTELQAQHDIVSKLDGLRVEVERLEKIFEQKVGAILDLKASLLDAAFNGNL